MAKALREVKGADLTRSPIFDEWTAFVDLANARLAVFRFFQSERYISSRACDNVKVSWLTDSSFVLR
jgi:hypothetical protein